LVLAGLQSLIFIESDSLLPVRRFVRHKNPGSLICASEILSRSFRAGRCVVFVLCSRGAFFASIRRKSSWDSFPRPGSLPRARGFPHLRGSRLIKNDSKTRGNDIWSTEIDGTEDFRFPIAVKSRHSRLDGRTRLRHIRMAKVLFKAMTLFRAPPFLRFTVCAGPAERMREFQPNEKTSASA